MTIRQAYQQLLLQLYELYDDREAAHIANWVMEHITGLPRIDRILHKDLPLTESQLSLLQQYTQELLLHKPVQYVLQEAWFAGMALYVDENVLIPRPETEELTEWMLQLVPAVFPGETTVLDIGTGSGCIPIALKKKKPHWQVHALDISAAALQVASRNATAQGTAIVFHEADILNETGWPRLPQPDVIVSNPPYIRQSEQAQMQRNVLAFEPHLALFVPDTDALLFYREIARFALAHLNPGGLLFFEINEALGKHMITLLEELGFTGVELKQDLQGKDRMLKAVKQ
jgi:release factor glutamine methyltransferase